MEDGSTVVLDASAAEGFRFTSWTGDPACSGQAPQLALERVASDLACSAGFVARIQVSSEIAPAGGGVVAAAAESAAALCEGGSCTVDVGSDVVLAAAASDGYRFTHWSGCESATGPLLGQNSLRVTAPNASQRCTANFERIFYTVEARAAAGGTVAASAGNASCTGARCTVAAGGDVTFTISADPGYAFSGWNDCPSGGRALTLANIRADQICTASSRVEPSSSRPPPAQTIRSWAGAAAPMMAAL